MCLIVFKRNEKENFTYEDFLIAVENNPDGTGIMYPKDGRVIHKKYGKPTAEQNKKLYEEFIAQPKAALHVRIKTHGDISDVNSHPFKVLDKDKDGIDLYMMHNGTIDTHSIDSTLSDTWHFVNMVLRPMVKARPFTLVNPVTQAMLKKLMGYSRLVFFYGDGTHVVVDDGRSVESSAHGGVWLSNNYSLSKRYSPPAKTNNSGRQSYHSYNEDWDDVFHRDNDEKLYDRQTKTRTSETQDYVSPSQREIERKKNASFYSPIYEEEGWWDNGEFTRYDDVNKETKEEEDTVIKSSTDLFAEASSLEDLLDALVSLEDTDIDNICHEDPTKARDILLEIKNKHFEEAYEQEEQEELEDRELQDDQNKFCAM